MNASPEAAAGGGLAMLRTGDMIRIDLNNCSANMLIAEDELATRQSELAANGGFEHPENQSPWQQYFRELVTPFSEGMVLRDAPNYKSIAQTRGIPRDNH